jgi:hypothetical protein
MVAVLGLFALVAAAWIRDVPDVPLEERADVFLLLGLLVAVLGFTAERGLPRLRGALGWIRSRPDALHGASLTPPRRRRVAAIRRPPPLVSRPARRPRRAAMAPPAAPAPEARC